MIPLRDENPCRHVPIVNYAMMGLCALVFLQELRAGADLDSMIEAWALIPARFLALVDRGAALEPAAWVPFVSSTFLHGGWLHFLGNTLNLWIFGDNVEDWLGPSRYLAFYLGGGLVAGLAHVAANPGSVVPTVGASGAIAAVMGAYLVLHPRARIQSLVLLVVWVRILPVYAWVYLGVWFVHQLASATYTLGSSDVGVAWWAHAGGFAFGASLVLLLGRRPLRAAAQPG